jgi:hypothetical protein
VTVENNRSEGRSYEQPRRVSSESGERRGEREKRGGGMQPRGKRVKVGTMGISMNHQR